MDIIDIAIATSKATAIDPSDISASVSDYLDEHGVQIETDTTLSVAGMPADAGAVGVALNETPSVQNSDAENVDLDIADQSGNVVMRITGGHIQTKNFDSSVIGDIESALQALR